MVVKDGCHTLPPLLHDPNMSHVRVTPTHAASLDVSPYGGTQLVACIHKYSRFCGERFFFRFFCLCNMFRDGAALPMFTCDAEDSVVLIMN